MLEFLSRLFGREEEKSKNAAKERLRLILVHDRACMAPHLLETLREELIEVISKYMEIEESGFEVSLEQGDDSMALVANIPIREVKRKLAEA
ncbi:MAG: cell division topological specificity factor MinE [Limnochordia bacterium]|jgi:cell division topological specificity factor